MSRLFLVCKSYLGDIRRVELLLKSIELYNAEKIPCYLIVPDLELAEFTALVGQIDLPISLISDDQVIECNKDIKLLDFRNLPGQLSQQIVKSEAWRFIAKHCELDDIDYLCIDSEAIFIKSFYASDFYSKDGHLLTVMHLNDALLDLARKNKVIKVERDFINSCEELKRLFEREGLNYAFSPTPVLWSSKVWRDLELSYLKPKKQSILDVLSIYPNELHWYGEALLRYRSIPIKAVPPLFRVYHYDWEYFYALKHGENLENLKKTYLGILKQSNWDYELDFGAQAKRKNILSRLWRAIKRRIVKLI